MFEFSVAFKYLIPRWRQLSVSIISLVSMLVISLVVWLIVVFFSVKDGMEESWIEKLITLTAPVRILPTAEYYHSYYYLIDSISEKAGYTSKTIREKLESPTTNSFSSETDEEIPSDWPEPDLEKDGSFKDIVKKTFSLIQNSAKLPKISVSDFEMTAGTLVLKQQEREKETYLEYSTYIGSFDPKSEKFKKIILKNLPSIKIPPPSHEPIYLPKSFRDAGISPGDTGYISYYSPTISAMQEFRIPIYVDSFYDPGIMPLGGKFILASRNVIDSIKVASQDEDSKLTNGLNLNFDNIHDATYVKKTLQKMFEDENIDKYWTIETYEEFDFAKDLLQQLRSEKHLFSLISAVIIIVACSNIISMLIILVNDKKVEIGILRSMGACSWSIALIFGICGMTMGCIGSIIGIGVALLTLQNLEVLVNLISRLQGYDLFNPVFYGDILPNQVSYEVLSYVIITTVLISLLAGIVPAIKASLVHPSAILRSE